MAIDWNLARGPNSFQNALAQGMQFGSQLNQRRQQEERNTAMSAYAIDPANPKNFNALAVAAPEVAMQFRAQRDAAAQQAAERDIRTRAAQGDPAALAELAGIDTNAWRGLTSDQQAAEARNTQVIGQAAQYIATLPPEARAAAWDEQVGILSQTNPALGQYRGQYSDATLQAVIARAGAFDEFYRRSQPDVFSVTAGGSAFGRDAQGNIFPVIVPNYNGAPAGAPAGPQGGYNAPAGGPSGSPLSPPAPQAPQAPTRQSPLFPAAQWQEYQRAVGPALPAIVERDRPVIVNSQGAQVQTDVINGQIAYLVNGVWYDNPEGQ